MINYIHALAVVSYRLLGYPIRGLQVRFIYVQN